MICFLIAGHDTYTHSISFAERIGLLPLGQFGNLLCFNNTNKNHFPVNVEVQDITGSQFNFVQNQTTCKNLTMAPFLPICGPWSIDVRSVNVNVYSKSTKCITSRYLNITACLTIYLLHTSADTSRDLRISPQFLLLPFYILNAVV